MADKLLSSIIRNAIVPASAVILPFQAFVDAMPAFAEPAGALDVSGKNIKTISSAFLNPWATNYFALGFSSGDFSDNQLDAATIAAILTAFNVGTGDPLDISGGTNAEPTYQPEFYRVQVPAGSSYSNGATWNIHFDGADLEVIFKTGIALAASSVNTDLPGDQWLWIGVSDSPTAAQIVTKVIALWVTVVNKQKWTVVAGSASNQLKFSKSNIFAFISIDLNDAGFTILEHQVGNIDVTLATVVNEGRTVSFNSAGSVVTLTP
jgi:hypothetical protein